MQSNALAFYSHTHFCVELVEKTPKISFPAVHVTGIFQGQNLVTTLITRYFFFFTFTVFEKKTDRCVCKALLSEEEISMEQIQHFFLHPFFIFFYYLLQKSKSSSAWMATGELNRTNTIFLPTPLLYLSFPISAAETQI